MRTIPILLALACAAPPEDDFRSEGGASPDPTGVFEGTVAYVGPRPSCEHGRPVGRVVLTLFRSDNPPPPAGSAASALNLLTVPAQELFEEIDCAPDEGFDPTDFITRSVDFTWPEIPLGEEAVAYQIRGFFDRDADFNPFFSVSNLPTAGDVAGGAVLDVMESVPRFRAIELDSAADRPRGQVVRGITVTLGAPVNTERPVFRLDSGPLAADATLPATADLRQAESELFELTQMRLHLYPREQDSPITQALELGGLSISLTDPLRYAWYFRDVDANADGQTDMHPVLGSLGLQWQTPIVLMQRARNAVELEARVPSVTMVPAVRPTQTLFKQVSYPTAEMVLAPIAIVQTSEDARCRIPYVAPRNLTTTYEASTTECQKLPTGRFSVTVLHGLAGSTPVGGGVMSCESDMDCMSGSACVDSACRVPRTLSDTEWNLASGSFSSQAWTIPNELGDPNQIDEAVPEQGLAALFVVHDPDPSTDSREGCEQAIDPTTGMQRPIDFLDFAEYGAGAARVQEVCCAPIMHLCDVPLCDAASPPGSDVMLREQPTELTIDEDGNPVPSCLSFEMPAVCCR